MLFRVCQYSYRLVSACQYLSVLGSVCQGSSGSSGLVRACYGLLGLVGLVGVCQSSSGLVRAHFILRTTPVNEKCSEFCSVELLQAMASTDEP